MVRSFSYQVSVGLLAVLLGLLSLTHTACDGDGKSPYELGPYHMGEYWRSFVYFKEGTWWVYRSIQDRDTLYDTVKVVASNWEMVRYADESPKHWKVTKEWFRYVMTSTVQGDLIHQIPRLGLLEGDTIPFSRFFMERTVWDEGTISPFFVYRFDFASVGGTTSKTTLEKLNERVLISDSYLEPAQHFNVTRDWSWDFAGREARYYWVKNIGLVKRENLGIGESWELVDYKVIQ